MDKNTLYAFVRVQLNPNPRALSSGYIIESNLFCKTITTKKMIYTLSEFRLEGYHKLEYRLTTKQFIERLRL